MNGLAQRIWARDSAAFVGPDAPAPVHDAIAQRLGWLDAPAAASRHIDDLTAFAASIRRAGLTDAILLGMGGSSLCAEVLRDVSAGTAGGCRLTILDTTDERAIRQVTEALEPARTLFIVASKSGSTVEVTSLERHFFALMTERFGADAGRHFVAITDPGTPLEELASERGYRRTFSNPADIGGRYSALSLFGLVPAALAGHPLSALAASALRMADECQLDDDRNPAVALGSFMAAQTKAGRDKLTLLLPPAFRSFGDWIEQLVAESTGKDGDGVLPIVGEPLGHVRDYGADRAFVAILSPEDAGVVNLANELDRADRPVFMITTTIEDLGAEFFRWEFATAIAGARLGVNPFDEPNVRAAKQRTLAQLEARSATGAFRIEPAFVRGDGYSRREFRPAVRDQVARRRYIALLDFLPTDPARLRLFDTFRGVLRNRLGLATTHGIGPRYLHSTGQFHKGGPNSGIFVMLTATDTSATPVPGTDYTFSALKQAQALGDFDALVAGGRQVVHYHLEDPSRDFAATLERLISRIGD
jgi:glucose-6-phosphate isomerase